MQHFSPNNLMAWECRSVGWVERKRNLALIATVEFHVIQPRAVGCASRREAHRLRMMRFAFAQHILQV